MLFPAYSYFPVWCISSVILQQLVLSDKCPINYVTYKQSSGDDEDEEAAEHDFEPDVDTQEQTELKIEEYTSNGQQTTHFARYVRKSVGNASRVSSDNTGSDSEETEGADDSECDSNSSNSEHYSPQKY